MLYALMEKTAWAMDSLAGVKLKSVTVMCVKNKMLGVLEARSPVRSALAEVCWTLVFGRSFQKQ